MIKRVLQILMFLFSIGVSACVCDEPNITEKYIYSDFVARAIIVKNYKNENAKELYKADIDIKELYKGKVLKSIYVAGNSDGVLMSSCGIFIPENTELIIYARKNKDGKYSIGMCSGLFYLSNRNFKRQKRELDILRMLKSKNINFTSKIHFQEKAKLYNELKRFRGIELEKTYAIYEITFSSNVKVKNVHEIDGFGNSIDQKIIKVLYKSEWTSFTEGVKDKIPDNSKLLVGIYYYPKEKENPSFLSQFY